MLQQTETGICGLKHLEGMQLLNTIQLQFLLVLHAALKVHILLYSAREGYAAD